MKAKQTHDCATCIGYEQISSWFRADLVGEKVVLNGRSNSVELDHKQARIFGQRIIRMANDAEAHKRKAKR